MSSSSRLGDLLLSMARADAELARAGVSGEHRAELLTIGLPPLPRIDEIPGARLDRCPKCNAACDFAGYVLRRLP